MKTHLEETTALMAEINTALEKNTARVVELQAAAERAQAEALSLLAARDLEIARGAVIHQKARVNRARFSAEGVRLGLPPLADLLPHETLPPPTPEQLALIQAADGASAKGDALEVRVNLTAPAGSLLN
jgi:hypothetical protein